MDVHHDRSRPKRVVSSKIKISSDMFSDNSSSQSSAKDMNDKVLMRHQTRSENILNEIFKIIGIFPIVDM